MESVAYILIIALAIGTLFFAIAFREPPRIEKKQIVTALTVLSVLTAVTLRCDSGIYNISSHAKDALARNQGKVKGF